jgi:hypothetical protein
MADDAAAAMEQRQHMANRSSRCAPHEVDSFRSGSRFVFHSFPFATKCALHLEVEACLQCVNVVAALGISNIQIDRNSQLLVQALKGDNQDLASSIGSMFRDIKAEARLSFGNVNSCTALESVIKLFISLQIVV